MYDSLHCTSNTENYFFIRQHPPAKQWPILKVVLFFVVAFALNSKNMLTYSYSTATTAKQYWGRDGLRAAKKT